MPSFILSEAVGFGPGVEPDQVLRLGLEADEFAGCRNRRRMYAARLSNRTAFG
jgi:hypothetical protein